MAPYRNFMRRRRRKLYWSQGLAMAQKETGSHPTCIGNGIPSSPGGTKKRFARHIDLHYTRSPLHMDDRSGLSCQEMIRYIFSDKWWPYHRNENHQRPCLYNANERAIVNRLHDRAAHSRPVYISAHSRPKLVMMVLR